MQRKPPKPRPLFQNPFDLSEYGVIVKFDNGKYSVKTINKCYWCMSQYWNTEEEIRAKFTALHKTVLLQKDFASSIGMQNTIYDMINELKATKKSL